jgi:hypothetical protein
MGEPVFSHTGQRYVLGYDDESYGIWDRQSPATPSRRFPKSNEGWQQAWMEYSRLEPAAAPVGGGPPASAPGYAAPQYPQPQYGQPQYGAPQYGAPQYPQYGGYPQVPRNNGFAIASLVFGIIGGVIFALIFGFIGRSQIQRSNGTQKGEGMALAGIILGFVWLGLIVLLVATADNPGI